MCHPRAHHLTWVHEPWALCGACLLWVCSKFDEHSNRFVDAVHLKAILQDLHLPMASNDAQVAALTARIGSSGIILYVLSWVRGSSRRALQIDWRGALLAFPVGCLLFCRTVSQPCNMRAAHPHNTLRSRVHVPILHLHLFTVEFPGAYVCFLPLDCGGCAGGWTFGQQ